MILTSAQRRELAREITRLANADVDAILNGTEPAVTKSARRIGFTGPPGVGKSTLVGKFVERHAHAGHAVAVLAIDPASPYSRGAILGDRIRMDDAAGNPLVFTRSVSSRDASDGLCNNVADILLALERRGFDEIVLETVGVGQAEYAVKTLVDTVVLLVQPETGDGIQALKAGILEIADIIVIAKADLPGASRMKESLASTVRFGVQRARDWQVPVIPVSATTAAGFVELDTAVAAHAAWVESHRRPQDVALARTKYRVHDLLLRALQQGLARLGEEVTDRALRETYRGLVATLQRD